MKLKLFYSLFSLVVITSSLYADADPSDPQAHFIVIDSTKVLQDSKVMQNIRQQIEKQQEIYQKEFSKAEEALRPESNKIETASEKDKKAFAQKVEKLQQEVSKSRAKLEQAYVEAIQKINETLMKIIDQLAQSKNVNAVLQKAAVVWGIGKGDITSDASTALDKQLPSLKVTFPKDVEIKQ